MRDYIEADWYVNDGYVSHGSHRMEIDLEAFPEDASESEIERILDDHLDEEFRMEVSPYFMDKESLVEQIKNALQGRDAELDAEFNKDEDDLL